MSTRLLCRHFARVHRRLLDYAEHIGILAGHADVKGAAREGIIRVFLQENLPSLIEFKTGEIVDSNDARSGQLDIVLQSIASPRIPIFDSLQTTMVDAALGVIEVKSLLTTASWDSENSLKSALHTFQRVKALNRITPIHSLAADARIHRTTPCFLIAYKGPTAETLLEKLLNYSEHSSLSIDEYAPEIACILDPGYYIFRDDRWLFPHSGKGDVFRIWDETPEECLIGLFVYICRLIQTWNAHSHPTPFQDYFGYDFKYEHHTM